METNYLPETYKVNGDDLEKVFILGKGYFTPSISTGIGKLYS